MLTKFITLIYLFGEKRKLFATLPQEIKDRMDLSALPPEYTSAIALTCKNGFIRPDLSASDFEAYKGLDESIHINPMEISDTEREGLKKLCEVCPQMDISDNIGISYSTAEEYLHGEAWIDQLIQSLNPEWSNIEKVAFIDNAIGKQISYSPDFNTEVSDAGDARALWKIIDSGYGVCNGIAQVEQYILSRVGIESQMISGTSHAFLKLTNIEFPTQDGSTITGNTILDPTWNLAAHRFDGKPNNFCRSYEEIRKHDIKSNGEDCKAHKNDEKLSDATFDMPETVLRQIYTNIGIADRKGDFPIKTLIEKSKQIDDFGLSDEKSIQMQFELLQRYCPEFATCINSTFAILEDILLANPNLHFNKCVVNRVYSKTDNAQRPVLYVYANLPKIGNKFYLADKESGQFIELPQKEFEEKFECYEYDLNSSNGVRPWESNKIEEIVEDLTKSSGKIDSIQEEER